MADSERILYYTWVYTQHILQEALVCNFGAFERL